MTPQAKPVAFANVEQLAHVPPDYLESACAAKLRQGLYRRGPKCLWMRRQCPNFALLSREAVMVGSAFCWQPLCMRQHADAHVQVAYMVVQGLRDPLAPS